MAQDLHLFRLRRPPDPENCSQMNANAIAGSRARHSGDGGETHIDSVTKAIRIVGIGGVTFRLIVLKVLGL